MELCKGDYRAPHEEICYAVAACPMCLLAEELADAEKEIVNLQEHLDAAET